jgi:hypothetical protein
MLLIILFLKKKKLKKQKPLSKEHLYVQKMKRYRKLQSYLSQRISEMILCSMYVLVVEPDYLPDAEVLCFQPCLYPMKYLHPRSMYTLPRGGVQRGGTPSVGFGGSIPLAGGPGGKRAPSGGSGVASSDGGSGVKPQKQKLPYKSIL